MEEGNRSVAEGIKTANGKKLLVGFEGNCLKPLNETLRKEGNWNPIDNTWTLDKFKAKTDIVWPEKATHMHLATATTKWNVELATFETHYSEEIILEKEEPTTNLHLNPEKPSNTSNGVEFTAILISFSEFYRRRLKPMKRALHTTTIIHVKL